MTSTSGGTKSEAGREERTVKGAGLHASILFAETKLGTEPVARILAQVEAKLGPIAPYRLPSSRAPFPVVAEVWERLAEVLGSSFEARTAAFGDMGKYVAVTNLNGVFRAFLAVMLNPEKMAVRSEALWRNYFPHATVEFVMGAGRRSVKVIVHGVEGLPYVNALGVGWKRFGYELVGGKNVVVVERNLAAARFVTNEPLEFDISWD